jgi:thiaminase
MSKNMAEVVQKIEHIINSDIKRASFRHIDKGTKLFITSIHSEDSFFHKFYYKVNHGFSYNFIDLSNYE